MNQKILKVFGLIFFLAFAIFAIAYFRERLLYIDSANSFFKMVQFRNFSLPAGRISKAIVQVFPLLAIKLGLSLKNIGITYSLAYVLIYFLVFWVLIFKMKKTGIGMLMIVVLVVGVRHAFFYTSTETPLGEAFVILLLGFMYLDREKSYSIWLFYPLSALFILLAFFSHPITLFPLLFVIVFVMFDTKSFSNKKYYILLAFIALIYSLKYFTTETDSYEGKIFSRLNSFAALLNDINTSYAFRFINSRLKSLYQLPVIWLLLTTVFYMLKKEYSKILLYLSFNILFFVVLILTFQKGDSSIAVEKNIMPIILTTFIPLLVETDKIQQKQWSVIGQGIVSYSLIIVILISSYNILRTNIYYKNRIAYLWEMVNTARTHEGRKFIVERENINPWKLGVEYSLSTETLLLTSIESPDSSLTIHCLLKSLAQTYDTTSTDQFIFMPYWPVNLKDMNTKYFRLPEGKYRILNEKFN